MSYKPRWDNGDWLTICDECGRKFKASQLRQRWDGLMVCDRDWEPRQPQDFVRGVADKMAPPWSRSEQSDQFIFVCTIPTSSCYVGAGTVGCSQVGQTWGQTYTELYTNYYCDYSNSAATPGFGVAGCTIAGRPLMGL